MPYKSDAQRRKFHAMANAGEISEKTVKHWDKESKGKDLPEKVEKKAAALAPLLRASRLYQLIKTAEIKAQLVPLLKAAGKARTTVKAVKSVGKAVLGKKTPKPKPKLKKTPKPQVTAKKTPKPQTAAAPRKQKPVEGAGALPAGGFAGAAEQLGGGVGSVLGMRQGGGYLSKGGIRQALTGTGELTKRTAMAKANRAILQEYQRRQRMLGFGTMGAGAAGLGGAGYLAGGAGGSNINLNASPSTNVYR